MAQNGVVQVQVIGNLDPTAQEYWPTYPHHYPYLLPPPPPPPLPLTQYILPPPPPQQASYIPPTIPTPATAPTRAIVLSAVPLDISESSIRRDLEVFGDVRAVQMERFREGLVTVHFYDLRASHAALSSIRDQHMLHQHRLRLHFSSIIPFCNEFHHFEAPPPPPPPPAPGLVCGRAVWAHFTVPVLNAYPDGINQGTLVLFNLDPTVSASTLRNVFNPFGAVKELRETPMKRHQRFVEFYDVRDAAKALAEMNGKEINGKSVMIEYSRPGGHFNKLHHHHHNQSHHHYPRHVHDPTRHHHPHNHPSNFHHHNKPHSPTLSSQQQPRTLPFRHKKSYQGVRRGCRSSPSSEESVETAAISKLTLNDRTNNNNNNNNDSRINGGSKAKGNENGPNSNSGKPKGARPWKGRQKNYDPRYLIKEEAIIVEGSSNGGECVKDTRTTVMIKNIPNKYSQKLLLNMLDNHCIHCNEQISGDNDQEQQQQQPFSAYDFVYLPIDFNNKCNVGYGFVNMTSPEATLRLYKAFHHQHWEVFNSRKICEVTYARVQGLEALKEHFKNSKFACENDEYLPVVFTPPRDGRHTTAPLPIVFSTALTPTSSPTLHHSTDIYSADFTSTTSTITHPSSEDFDLDHDQVHPTNDNDNLSQTSSDGGDVINAINDDDNEMIDGSSEK